MLLTHSFVAAVTPGWYQYIFYAIQGGPYDHREEFVNEFRWNLESLGRSIGDKAVVVVPFQPDIPTVANEVGLKDWTYREREQVQRTPSLLVLTKHLAEFSPRSDPWLLLHFGEDRYSDGRGYLQLKKAFAEIAEAIAGPDAEPEQLYKVARSLARTRRDYQHVFEAKPGIWGISVDLVEVADILSSEIRARQKKLGHWPRRWNARR